MWHWILYHGAVLNDIGLAWVAPVLLVLVVGRMVRPGYRHGEPEFARVSSEERREKPEERRSSAA